MSYPADLIIPIDARISAAGLANANFGTAMIFAKVGEAPTGSPEGVFKTYGSTAEVAEDYAVDSETYAVAQAWLGGIPRNRQVMIFNPEPQITDFVETLNDARDQTWWYWTFLTESQYEQPVADLVKIAEWCESNGSFFFANTTSADVLDSTVTNDSVSTLQALGFRHTASAFHTADLDGKFTANPLSGIYLAKHFAAVNYNGVDTTITGEFKKSPGLGAMNLRTSQYAVLESKNAAYYSVVDLQGSVDSGRWLNTRTHSTYGEFIDDVVNLDAFINGLTVALYNVIANMPTKLKQTPIGQSRLITRARQFCEQYIRNGYLGPRNYTDPFTGEENKYTPGFEILTKPEDILNLTDEQRNAREAYPINIMLFRAGAIHKAPVDLTVY